MNKGNLAIKEELDNICDVFNSTNIRIKKIS